jgi:ubiquinone/menaquinone biosynthesis C-methylase UbiE
MDRAEIKLGQKVLDVGCGCGETTLDLARWVGDAGLALGVDISALLLAEALKLARESAISNVRFEEADAQTYSFPEGGFDVVFSRFGIMFFENPAAAFRNLRSALKRGGRIAFVCWPEPRENLFVTIPLTAAAEHIALPATRTRRGHSRSPILTGSGRFCRRRVPPQSRLNG